ncbi:hypothetical protein DL95DRAFT_416933 [Leptodontidium sp. 2 PMI_412]|nr:hypothetical protein DL95DRAFT_416933 [Leptodontidium sp. 2 PMI_412]
MQDPSQGIQRELQSMSLGSDYPSNGYVWAPQETAFQVEIPGGYKTGYAPGEPPATHARRRYRLLPSKFPNSTAPLPRPNRSERLHTPRSRQLATNLIPQRSTSRSPNVRHKRPSAAHSAPWHTKLNIQPLALLQSEREPLPLPMPIKQLRAALWQFSMLMMKKTPRELSMSRYKQNHEWMKEILSSPYSINQIIPANLGLNVRSKLTTLTEGIFDALPPLTTTRMSLNLAMLVDWILIRLKNSINKDIEKMKAKHAKRLALLSSSKKQLRFAVNDLTDTGPEYWCLEVDDIIAQVEASVGRHAAAVKELIRIQDGGYEEAPAIPSPQPAPTVPTPQITPPGSHNGSQHNRVLAGDANMANATLGSSFPTPQAHLQTHLSAGTLSNLNMPFPQLAAPPNTQQEATQRDVNMGDADEQTAGHDSASGEWVVVPPSSVSPAASAHAQPPSTSTELGQVQLSTASAPISNASPLALTANTSTVNTLDGSLDGSVGYGPRLYVQMTGLPELLVCCCVMVTGGGRMLLISQIIPVSKVEEADSLVVVIVVMSPFGPLVVIVVGPPRTGDRFQTTFDTYIVFVVIGRSAIMVLVVTPTEVVMRALLILSVVDYVSLYVIVTGAMLIVVEVDNTKGGGTNVHGG